MSTTKSASRTALVVGATGGIGGAVALRLAGDGYSVAVHYSSNQSRAEALATRITDGGASAITVGGDVADENAIASAFEAIEEQFGGIDVVVNTAGVMHLAPVIDLDLDELDMMHRINIRGTFIVSQQAARRVRAGGAINQLLHLGHTHPIPRIRGICCEQSCRRSVNFDARA